MAEKFLAGINLCGTELQNAVVQNTGTAPSGAKEGQLWFDTSASPGVLKVYQSGQFREIAIDTTVVSLINLGSGVIDLDNLPESVQTAVTNAHTHSNSAALALVSGTNTGDETQATIKTKLGAASSGVDGYLAGADWTTFNAKASGTHNHDSTYAPISKGVTGGDAHDHSGGDGGQIAYSSLSGTPTLGSAAAKNAGSAAGNVPNIATGGLGVSHVVLTDADGNLTSEAKKTAFNLDLGTGAGTVATGNHTHDYSATFAPIAEGVTNGDAHDHSGGDGAQIAYSSLSGLPTLGTAAAKNTGTASGAISLNGAVMGNSQTVETNSSGSLISVAKQTGYNLALGTAAGTVSEGNHNHNTVYPMKAGITGATKCKITYNGDGIVTAGADLAAADIPALDAGKITSGQFAIGLMPRAASGFLKAAGATSNPSYAAITAGDLPTHSHVVGDLPVNVANGLCPLDANSKVPAANMPSTLVANTYTAATEAAMLALTADVGDVCIRTEQSKTYILVATPASTLANWKEMLSPTSGVTSVNTRTGAITLAASDVGLGNVTNESKATMFASPTLTGTPLAPTAAKATNNTQIATTAYVQTNLGDYAPKASPTFTGVPAAPTASVGTNTTQLATCAFVQSAVSSSGKKYSADIGNGTATQIDVVHNLGSRDAMVVIRETSSPYQIVYTDAQCLDTNTVRLIFGAAPAASQYRVTVMA